MKANVAYVFDATDGRDFLVSALVNLVDGIKGSAGYVLNGNCSPSYATCLGVVVFPWISDRRGWHDS